MFHLSREPAIQSRLRQDVCSVGNAMVYPSSHAPVPAPKELDSLPLLDAVIMETLRLHPAIAGPQPRVTPMSDVKIGPYNGIPPFTRVSAQASCLHQNPEVFPAPQIWLPERWLGSLSDSEKSSVKNMHRWFWAFGSGT